MNLGQALLDQQVVDRTGQLMGKVDGIVLEIRDGKAPRVACLMIGGGTAARRIRPGFAEWLLRWHNPANRDAAVMAVELGALGTRSYHHTNSGSLTHGTRAPIRRLDW